MNTELQLYTSGFDPKDIFLYQYLKMIAADCPGKTVSMTNSKIAEKLQWNIKVY